MRSSGTYIARITTLFLYFTNIVYSEDICKICGRCGSTFISCENKLLPSNSQVNSRVLMLIECNASLLFQSHLNSSVLQKIHVQDSFVLNIGKNAFESLPNLSVVEISNSSLRQLYPETFSQNYQLTVVDFSNNLLNDIPNTLFANTQMLRTIKLKGNNITNVLIGTFINSAKVKNLDISRNKIQNLGPGIFNISDVPNFANDLRVVLNISNNEMQLLNGSGFSQCSHVTILDLSNNKIKWIHESAFVGLVALQKLYLGFNKLTALKAGLFTPLVSLIELDLQKNELRNIAGYQFIALPNIMYIHLSRNKIQHLNPKAFSRLKLLKQLHLDHNELTDLGSSFAEILPSLVILNISVNNISYLRQDMFKGCSALTKIDLSDNSISAIEDHSFYGLTQVISLSLQRNSIADISCCSFAGLASLKTLNLEENAIKLFNYYLIRPLTNLENLYLSMDIDSECECNLFAKLKEKKINLILDSTVIDNECMEFNKIFLSKTTNFEEKCFNVSVFENQCFCLNNRPTSTLFNDLEANQSDFVTNEESILTNPPIVISSIKSAPDSTDMYEKPTSFFEFSQNATLSSAKESKLISLPSDSDVTTAIHTSLKSSADQHIPRTGSYSSIFYSTESYSDGSSNDNQVVRYAMYSFLCLSILMLTGVLGMIMYRVWLRYRWRHHLYEHVQMTEFPVPGNSPV